LSDTHIPPAETQPSTKRPARRRWARNAGLVLVAILLLFLLMGMVPRGKAIQLRTYLLGAEVCRQLCPVGDRDGFVHGADALMTKVGFLRPIRLEVEPGVNLRLDPNDFISRSILMSKHHIWEPVVWQSLAGGMPEGGVFLDVGSHIGYFSLKGSRKVGAGGRVIAFEPNPTTVQALRDNLAASQAGNVTVVPVACTDTPQTLTLFDGSDSGNSGASSLSEGNAHSHTKTYQVPGRSIDDVVRELGLQRVDVAKVDVEGAELFVLRGARETLRRFHPKLVVEVRPSNLANMNTTVEQLFAFIAEAGYGPGKKITDDDWEWTAPPATVSAKP